MSSAPASLPVRDTVPTKTVAEILNAAADLIEPEGRWIQGALRWSAYGDSPERWCAAGAIDQASGLGIDSYIRTLHFVRHKVLGGVSLSTWNDAPRRTQKQVVATLRAAALAAATALQSPQTVNPDPGSQQNE